MNMAEQLPDIPVGPAISQERIVVEHNGLTTNADGHLLGDMFETSHDSLLDLLHVVVPEDKVDPAVQPADDLVPLLGTAEGEVPEVEDEAVRRDGLVPAADKGFIHVRYVPERPGTVAEDVFVVKMCVGGEPDLTGFKCPERILLACVLR